MKLIELWNRYKDYTQELSNNFRTLALAAAAICWFFKSEQVTFPTTIYISLLFIVGFFVADILHYSIGAFITRRWTRAKEKELHKKKVPYNADTEIDQPAWLDNWPLALFIIKGSFLLIAYLGIGKELLTRTLHS